MNDRIRLRQVKVVESLATSIQTEMQKIADGQASVQSTSYIHKLMGISSSKIIISLSMKASMNCDGALQLSFHFSYECIAI